MRDYVLKNEVTLIRFRSDALDTNTVIHILDNSKLEYSADS